MLVIITRKLRKYFYKITIQAHYQLDCVQAQYSPAFSLIEDKQYVNNPVISADTKKGRVNLYMDSKLFDYLDIITRLDGISINQYVSKLIYNDLNSRQIEYTDAINFFKK